MNILSPDENLKQMSDKVINSDEENGSSMLVPSVNNLVPSPRQARQKQLNRRQDLPPVPSISLPMIESDEEPIPLAIYSPKTNLNIDDDDGNLSDASVHSRSSIRFRRPKLRSRSSRSSEQSLHSRPDRIRGLNINSNISSHLL